MIKQKTKLILILFITVIVTFASDLCKAQINWGPVMDIAPNTFGKNRPRIVVDGDGDPCVIWGHQAKVRFAKWNGSGFTTPVQINPPGTTVEESFWMGPEIGSLGDTIYIVYKETPVGLDSSHVWCIGSTDGGLNFNSPVRVDYLADSLSRFPSVTVDDNGNPVVAFMKFDPGFLKPRWVVSRSSDMGSTFSNDVLAGDWSGPASEACDCCTGTIKSSGNKVAMLYRDNNNNIRDNWAGISSDTGSTFYTGFNFDQQNWFLSQCPSSGPDGVIIGDSLYTVFMNGASGMNRVYFNSVSLASPTPLPGNLLTGIYPGLLQQDYPRIDNSGKKVAIIWRDVVNGSTELPIRYTTDITSGSAFIEDTAHIGNANNADIALFDDEIHVAWQDNGTGTVKYRKGMFGSTTSLQESDLKSITLSTDPVNQLWEIHDLPDNKPYRISVYDIRSALVHFIQSSESNTADRISIDHHAFESGLYLISVELAGNTRTFKAIRY